MEEYKKYLADQILSEEKIVTYRSLSRAMKTHVNTAKGMLYEFHRSQNAMRPGTIHATYLIYGKQKVEKVQEDGDVEMTSSPPDIEPLSDEVETHSLTLVPGERLKDVLATYEEVSSFHIYSLARHPTREPQMLADVSQQVREQSNGSDASLAETYGSITNPNVRKRDRQGKGPVPTPAPAAPAAKPVKKEPAASTAKPAASESKAAATVKPESKPSSKENPFSAAKKGAAPPSLKKSGSSGIMSSFAKAAAKAASKPKEAPKKASTESPANNSPALSDDGEDDDEDIPAARASANSGRKSRKEREAELKRMMEESDEEEPEEKEEEPEDEPMEEAPEPAPESKPEPAEVVSSNGDGRRRGKRRVMKKKQIMDDQGYLVTIQEPAWEEFSEDEAPPPAPKPKPSTAPSSGSQKPKKAAPKGQGNIMSFFSKK